jgi:predicted DsbA family dithiol-disulfide isomerase
MGPQVIVQDLETLLEPEPVNRPAGNRILVIEYTDPISVWCWGMEPTIRRLETAYAGRVEVEVRMGGLFEDFGPMRESWTRMSGGRWKDSVRAFMDAVASQHRMPMDVNGLMGAVDDFTSTWPGCIAVKAAELQGVARGRQYLRNLREAALLDGRPIHHRAVQEELASGSGLDGEAFRRALDDGFAEEAFHRDLKECRDREITGFPTLLAIRGPRVVRIDGWVPWDLFDARLQELDPDLEPRRIEPVRASVDDILVRYGRCATREVASILGVSDDEAEILLDELAAAGTAIRMEIGSGLVWGPARGVVGRWERRPAGRVASLDQRT